MKKGITTRVMYIQHAVYYRRDDVSFPSVHFPFSDGDFPLADQVD